MKKVVAIGRIDAGRRKELTIDGETYTRTRIQKRTGTNPITVIPVEVAAAFRITPGKDVLAWRQIDDKRAEIVFLSPEEIELEKGSLS